MVTAQASLLVDSSEEIMNNKGDELKEKTLLKTASLSKKIGGAVILDRIKLNLAPGSIYGLLGKNGSGKTTLLYTLVGIYNAEAGSQVWINEVPCRARQLRSRLSLGFASQESHLLQNITVYENVVFFSRLFGVSHNDLSYRVERIMKYIEIDHLKQRKVMTLSAGEAKKVQIVCSLLHDPALVILDEPFVNLDDVTINKLQKIFKELAARGRTVLFTSHNLMIIESISDRIGILHHGRIIFEGETKQMLDTTLTVDEECPVGRKLQMFFHKLVGDGESIDESLNWL